MFEVDINWLSLAPPLVLLITASIGVLVALYLKGSRPIAFLSLFGVVISGTFNTFLFLNSHQGEPASSFALRYLADHPATLFNYIILLGTLLAILISFDYLQRCGLEHPEYYPLMLLSATGAMVMAAAGDLITLILGLEIMSLAVYVLSAWRQEARESEEAGMKYFLLGAFASAFFIYGIALMYGATGHFSYPEIAQAMLARDFDQIILATLGGAFILGGFGFKVALAPFHQWAPDVYTGAPTSVTAFMSMVVKAAAFAALLRVFSVIYPNLPALVNVGFSAMIVLTLVIANLAALRQPGVKRMLAYSAVAHAGYLGLAVLASGVAGTRAAIWYLSAYTLMTAGAFAVLTLLSDKNDYGDDLERFAGLGRKRPWLAATLSIFLLSLAGIPPLAGFAGKIMVFQAAIEAGYVALAVIAILTSIVAVVYYLRVVATMYFREPEYEPVYVESPAAHCAIFLAALGTVLLGILPGWWYQLISAGQQLMGRF